MRYTIFIAWAVLSLFIVTECSGQPMPNQEMLGIGAYSSDFVNVFSGRHNQAALAELKSFSLGIFARQRFSMKALSVFNLGAGLPLGKGVAGLQAQVEGYQAFKKQRWTVSYARPLFPWLALGASFDYLHMVVPTKGTANGISFSVSALARVNNKWRVGFQTFNPVQAHYKNIGSDAIPTIYQVGVGYQPSDIFLLTAEAQFTGAQKSFLLAFRYDIIPLLSLKAGGSTGINPVYAGVVFHLKKFRVLISAQFHKQLGLSPGIGGIYQNLLYEK